MQARSAGDAACRRCPPAVPAGGVPPCRSSGSASAPAQLAGVPAAAAVAAPSARRSPAAAAPPMRRRLRRRAGRRPPSLSGTRVDMLDSARAIGTQIAAQTKGFLPFESGRQRPAAAPRSTTSASASPGSSRATSASSATSTSCSRRSSMALFKFIEGRPRRHPPARADDGTLQPARRAPPRRQRRAHPGQLDHPQPRHQGARERAHARRVDGLRRVARANR